jgi:ATP-dependent Lhr-like helicase
MDDVEQVNTMLSVGPDSERSFGAKNFLELTSVFTADPLVEVIAGVQAVGHVNPLALERRGDGEVPVLLLAGRTWVVENVDWRRRRAWVRETAGKGRSIWGGNPRGLSAAVAGSIRSVGGTGERHPLHQGGTEHGRRSTPSPLPGRRRPARSASEARPLQNA